MLLKICGECKETKMVSEFYQKKSGDGFDYRCKDCARAYQREYQRNKTAAKKAAEQAIGKGRAEAVAVSKHIGSHRSPCIGCGVSMYNPQSKVCQKCARNTKKFDIKTAADYDLSGDDVIRGLAFLDACGVLKEFLDKCYGGADAFIEDTQREPRININDIDPSIIEAYEEHDSNWFEISILKSPIAWERKRK
jgi:hypothetical protein